MNLLMTTDEVSGKIQSIIQEATDELYLISPYIQLKKKSKNEEWEKLKTYLRYALTKDDINVIFIVREPNKKDKTRFIQNILENLREFMGVRCKVILVKNLHSKVYFNGKEALITSLNLYMSSALRNYEIGVSFDENGVIKKVRSYIDFLVSEGKSAQNEEEMRKILEETIKYKQNQDKFELIEFKVITKGSKWYKVKTAEGDGNIAIDSNQNLLVGASYRAKAKKEIIRDTDGSRIVFSNIQVIYYLGKSWKIC